MFFECLFPHPLQSVRRRAGKEFVPTTFRLDLGQEPCTDSFLLALGQLVRFLDRTFKESSHDREVYAVFARCVNGGSSNNLQTLMRVSCHRPITAIHLN